MTPDQELEWSVVRVSGPDAFGYLQSQLTQDLEGLDREGRWSLLLEPDGAVLTSCMVRTSGSDYEVVVERESGEATLARLRRFHLRSKCTLELAETGEGPFDRVAQMVEASWPGSREFRAQLAPQSYGAALVSATVSFTKGCFTGQELVARLDARGANVPWRMVRLEGPTLARLEEVAQLKGPPGPQGVTTAIERPGVVAALAIVHRTLLESGVLDGFDDVRIGASTP